MRSPVGLGLPSAGMTAVIAPSPSQISMRFSEHGILPLAVAGIVAASTVHGGQESISTDREAAQFKSQFASRCARDQRGMDGNQNMSDLMLSRVCDCTADKMHAAIQAGLLNGIDATREKDVFWGRAGTLLRKCANELVLPSPSNPKWSKASQSDGAIVYVDLSSIQRSDQTVTMFELNDYSAPKTFPKGDLAFLSMKSKSVYDCSGRRFRAAFFYVYAGNMGAGKLITTAGPSDTWNNVVPGSKGDTLWNVACKRN